MCAKRGRAYFLEDAKNSFFAAYASLRAGNSVVGARRAARASEVCCINWTAEREALFLSQTAILPATERDGDYADPQASEESPRNMSRRRGRRARRLAAPSDHAANGGADAGWSQLRAAVATLHLPGAPHLPCRAADRIFGGRSPRQRLRSLEDATPPPSLRQQTAGCRLRTLPEAPHARHTSHSRTP